MALLKAGAEQLRFGEVDAAAGGDVEDGLIAFLGLAARGEVRCL
ncbi:hypothetical protein [Luteolibacter luteus]|nr:hypothetical protein [Luteolibacter luteus]